MNPLDLDVPLMLQQLLSPAVGSCTRMCSLSQRRRRPHRPRWLESTGLMLWVILLIPSEIQVDPALAHIPEADGMSTCTHRLFDYFCMETGALFSPVTSVLNVWNKILTSSGDGAVSSPSFLHSFNASQLLKAKDILYRTQCVWVEEALMALAFRAH